MSNTNATKLTPAERRALAAIVHATDAGLGHATNGKIHGVPGHGAVMVQYRTIHRLGDLGLVTWIARSETVSVYQGHRFGRLGGCRSYLLSWVEATPTEAGRAALAGEVVS